MASNLLITKFIGDCYKPYAVEDVTGDLLPWLIPVINTHNDKITLLSSYMTFKLQMWFCGNYQHQNLLHIKYVLSLTDTVIKHVCVCVYELVSVWVAGVCVSLWYVALIQRLVCEWDTISPVNILN